MTRERLFWPQLDSLTSRQRVLCWFCHLSFGLIPSTSLTFGLPCFSGFKFRQQGSDRAENIWVVFFQVPLNAGVSEQPVEITTDYREQEYPFPKTLQPISNP
jgi:hypothetical protein